MRALVALSCDVATEGIRPMLHCVGTKLRNRHVHRAGENGYVVVRVSHEELINPFSEFIHFLKLLKLGDWNQNV